MASCSILIWAASRSDVFLALETGKRIPCERVVKGRKKKQREKKRRESHRIDGKRMNTPTERGGLRTIYTGGH